MHGYSVSRWIGDRSDSVLAVEGAALYQALHRIERKKWVSSYRGNSENNRRAKFYELTAVGRAQLKSESAVWRSRWRRSVSTAWRRRGRNRERPL